MRIVFVHQYAWPYVQKDLDTLRLVHNVRERRIPSQGKWNISVFNDLIGLWVDVQWCDVAFCWFGKVHAFFAVLFSKMLGKKTVVVAGGDDVGMYRQGRKACTLPAHPLKKYLIYFISKHANKIITISMFNHWEAIRYARADPKKTIMIYHGFDAVQFRRSDQICKDNTVVTVGVINDENYDRKGFRLFVESARFLPDVNFLVVGPSRDNTQDKLKKKAPSNVFFTGPLYGQDLIRILSKGKVYVQASEWESFGCAVAEAMLCECVPVVANRTAMPEVVGEAGYYIDNLNAEELSRAIKEAMADREMGIKARERIIRNFSLEKR
ncbi:MAG: glycosyltransferase family 4 protein, partial [candidate division Zixibacteria bacterium]|nr:glycosyltransferase family 4 protein [candidate division Zixibacteria bacterium]